MTRLPDLLKTGCILTMPEGWQFVLADAAVLPGQALSAVLWFVPVFGEGTEDEHFLEYDTAEPSGPWINLRAGSGALVATLGHVADEPGALRLWHAWQSYLSTPAGDHARRVFAEMRRAAREWSAVPARR